MANRRFHVASLLMNVVVWTGENDTKTISMDANLFENGAKQLRFRLKTDQCGRGLKTIKSVHFQMRQLVLGTSKSHSSLIIKQTFFHVTRVLLKSGRES